MKTKLVAVIALIFCAFMAEASKVEGNGEYNYERDIGR